MTPRPNPTTPARLRLGIAVAVVASIALLALAVTVALIGGRDPEVAGSFVLTVLALLLLSGAAIGVARLIHGDDPETVDVAAGRATTRRLFGAIALLGGVLTGFLAILTPFPHVLAAAIPLVMVVVLARGPLVRTEAG
ncbi:hypothetical protein CFI00_15705 [Nocardioides sp. S5]|uniref:hypothetical protein n=1 Tax=Nocardioides sp. S5 TaxID=2017486 RepID=UPI001A8FD010|nr:hypothetical protein [Nocardioides sp. S5]QSR31928.1 hypothetical protein CFI00_15705 [Nocardioides sp. S5]